jgi:hypothetical protein
MPLRMIIIAAKIVSRASAAAASPPASISETMSATSHGHGERQHQRAEGLANAVSHNLGVVHRRQHASDQAGAERQHKQRMDERQRCGEQQPARKRTEPSPDWQVITKHNLTKQVRASRSMDHTDEPAGSLRV